MKHILPKTSFSEASECEVPNEQEGFLTICHVFYAPRSSPSTQGERVTPSAAVQGAQQPQGTDVASAHLHAQVSCFGQKQRLLTVCTILN